MSSRILHPTFGSIQSFNAPSVSQPYLLELAKRVERREPFRSNDGVVPGKCHGQRLQGGDTTAQRLQPLVRDQRVVVDAKLHNVTGTPAGENVRYALQ